MACLKTVLLNMPAVTADAFWYKDTTMRSLPDEYCALKHALCQQSISTLPYCETTRTVQYLTKWSPHCHSKVGSEGRLCRSHLYSCLLQPVFAKPHACSYPVFQSHKHALGPLPLSGSDALIVIQHTPAILSGSNALIPHIPATLSDSNTLILIPHMPLCQTLML